MAEGIPDQYQYPQEGLNMTHATQSLAESSLFHFVQCPLYAHKNSRCEELVKRAQQTYRTAASKMLGEILGPLHISLILDQEGFFTETVFKFLQQFGVMNCNSMANRALTTTDNCG